MKTLEPNLHRRYLVVSIEDQKVWEADRQYWIDWGYDQETAEQFSWDAYWAARREKL